jgi:uroporphyrinogen-III synthase
MMMLKNLSVLVTRPAPQGAMLCEEITALGGYAVYFPTIAIIPCQNANLLREQIAHLQQYDWLIFVSRQAVAYSIQLIREHWPILPANIKFAAIGEGTAEALQAAGLREVVYPLDEWTSEGLLKLADFQQITGQQVALVKGLGGREILAETLTARGAKITQLITYQRSLPIYNDISEYLDLLRQKKIDIIVCTSGESLHNLIKIIGVANQALLFNVLLVVVSSRLVEIAKNAGFKHIFLAANAGHKAIIDTLCFIKGNIERYNHVRK